jgi:hypothetical protein
MYMLFGKAAPMFAQLVSALRSLATVAEPEPVDYPFSAGDVGQLQRLTQDGDAATVDPQTWHGLLLDPYFAMLTGQVSIFGKQVLHHRLADGLADAPRAALGERLRSLMADPAQLAAMQRASRPLRAADTEIATLLLEDTLPAVPKWASKLWLLFVGLVASVAAVALSPLAWLGAGFFAYHLLAIQVRYHERIAAWDRAMNAVQMMLRASSLLGAMKHPMLGDFDSTAQLAGKLNRRLSRSWVTFIPLVREYYDWFLLDNVSHYFKGIGIVGKQRDFLIACYTRCANLEADLALAQHLLGMPSTCWAARSGEGSIAIDAAVHPLLQKPAALSIDLRHSGAFISGQNGIGKSTLLRTVGLNLVVARAFGFCYAATASVPMLPVYASMQSEDSLLGGESLYIAELQRAKELLAVANGPHRGTYIIDEIFRGTNHLESVSAAAAVLDVLAANSMVIVSSHNLVLATLLEHRLAPFCVAVDERGALTLSPGLLAHTNGIALLAQRGFGPAIEARAAKVFDWLSAYLAQPDGGNGVLGSAPALRQA